MPTFDTPEPIAVTLDVGVGDIRVVAGDRTDTIVDVRPSDPAKKSDVTAAEQTRVEYSSGRLLVQAQKGWRWSFRSGRESIDVQIELPAGSQVNGEAGVAALHCTGHIGGCRFKTGVGDIQLDQAGPLELKAGAGDITVGQVLGDADVSTAGAVGIGSVDGAAVIKNSNGDTWIGEVTGDVRVKAANGRITIDRARGAATREDRQRRPAPGRGRTWCRPRRKRERQDRRRDPRRRRGLAGPQDGVRQRPQRTAGCRSSRPRTRRRSTCAPGPPTATSRSAAAFRTTRGGMRHDHHDISIRDRGHRAAQVLRRQGRARRHRPGRRRGNDLRPARPQRRREDHGRADPVHLDRVRRRPGACRGP